MLTHEPVSVVCWAPTDVDGRVAVLNVVLCSCMLGVLSGCDWKHILARVVCMYNLAYHRLTILRISTSSVACVIRKATTPQPSAAHARTEQMPKWRAQWRHVRHATPAPAAPKPCTCAVHETRRVAAPQGIAAGIRASKLLHPPARHHTQHQRLAGSNDTCLRNHTDVYVPPNTAKISKIW